MEEIRGTDTAYSGESPLTITLSSEHLPAPAGTLTSSVDKDLDSGCLQRETTGSIDEKIEQNFPAPSSFDNNTHVVDHVKPNNEQEASVKDSKSSVQQTLPGVSSQHVPTAENLDSRHQQQIVVDEPESVVFTGIPDVSKIDKDRLNTTESSSLPSTCIDDARVMLPEIFAYPLSDSLETSKEEMELIPEHENEASVKVDSTRIDDDSSASIKSSPTQERPTDKAFGLTHQAGIGHTQKNTLESAKSFKDSKYETANRGLVDTAAPIESVKKVVTMFGGILDWKEHKVHILEKHKHVDSELERLQEEVYECKRQSEAVAESKMKLLKELENTGRIIEELNLKLEQAKKEEAQAMQESELAQLCVKKMEQCINGDSSIAAKALVEVAKERLEVAVNELKAVKEELKSLQAAVNGRDGSMREAQEAVSVAKQIEKTVEQQLDQRDECRIDTALARDEDYVTWEKELRQANEEVQHLDQQLNLSKDLKLKLDSSITLLNALKAEFASYMRLELKQESESNGNDKMPFVTEKVNGSTCSIQALVSTGKALEEVKISIKKTDDEVNCLRVAASSLKSQLHAEKAALEALKQMEVMASITVTNLESELARTMQELEDVRMKEKEARDKMEELPKLLQQATQEADQAHSVARMAHEELQEAKEEAEQAEATARTIEIKFQAATKETEAAKVSEKLAIKAVQALQGSEQAASMEGSDSTMAVTLPLEDYFTLSKRAHESEELGHSRVAAALAQIEEAKKSESNSSEALQETYKELEQQKEALKVATEKAEKAKEGKLGAEQELRKLRTELEQRRRAIEASKSAVNPVGSPLWNADTSIGKEVVSVHSGPEVNGHGAPVKKKKKSLFPRIALFFARKKSHHVN